MTVKAGKVVVAFSVLFVGSLLLLKDVPGRNAPARRELRTVNDPPRQKQKGGGARDLKFATSPAGRDGRKLSFDETKEVLLKVLNGPEGFRVLRDIAAKMDSDAGAAADGKDADQSRRLGHHLTVHFPDCVLAGEAECKEAILADLESNPNLYSHIGGFVEFETRKKRSVDPDDPDHDKVVLKTDSTGTKVIGLNGDCIVHYPFKWLKDGVEIAIGPWDCSLGQHPEELQYCQPLSPTDCCDMIKASIGHETDDHGHTLACYVEKEEETDLQKVIVVVDKVDGKEIVVEDAIPKIAG
mmetsp:Transcript_19498/g.46113  ORF Transcript_19498/g.46113 Transcript_19498/m.46113 type:complete len:297 (+) Transcript_19498:117-1007(+)|eukprot:CAMPEP_0185801428 /NCGR_PEP_ID=MMETSP1322-20130828/1428_1 /TAXON_ID=265543 /ORGANISM="Minutocellus polymorphus, Strain RCC2270" /LENGTH=296 /DNA_ID=CAMNT_0028497121 /DNA_START=70 /DNA_END=960 /DNA_ORIENTATION=-